MKVWYFCSAADFISISNIKFKIKILVNNSESITIEGDLLCSFLASHLCAWTQISSFARFVYWALL